MPLIVTLALLAATAPQDLSGAANAPWSAHWIWKERESYTGYNDTIEARRLFTLPAVSDAVLRISADTTYRLYVNGQWVNDGPSRSWPDHYQYDVVDVAKYLRAGENEIRVIAKFFGIGTFHQIPQEAGLLAQLDARTTDGKAVHVGTDASWEVRDVSAWARWAPKQSVQMGPFEIYDARRAEEGAFAPALVRYAAGEGPWKNLEARDCPLLTREPVAPRTMLNANVVKRTEWKTYIFPTASWAYDQVVYASNKVCITGAFATVVDLAEAGTLDVDSDEQSILIDGQSVAENHFKLEAGKHFLFCALSEYFGHWRLDTELHLKASVPMILRNPLTDSEEMPWCYSRFEGGQYVATDMAWSLLSKPEKDAVEQKLTDLVKGYAKKNARLEDFKADLGRSARIVGKEESTESVHYAFKEREVVKGAVARVENPEGPLSGKGAATIQPSAEGDVELVYDLGEQNVGYYQFDINGEAGLTVDISGVEYIDPNGRVQHTERYRNSFRYICREGDNQFTSLMRRSGRFLFVTLRHQTRPASLRALRLVESTYPAESPKPFECNDPNLNAIWRISAHGLKLCMEDTFTDCPLYEQTLWMGDARNEALFGYTAFGSGDLGRRCARLAGYSLEKYPLIQSQVPSTWEIIIPSFDFLWDIMVWEYYAYSGDKAFLEWCYPKILQNLGWAEQHQDARGLFSVPFWNFLDWSGIDDNHPTVTHNNMLAVGAIQAARRVANVLGETGEGAWFDQYESHLKGSINALWDEKRGAYPDSVHENGTVSPRFSVHNAMFALLYGVAPEERRQTLLETIVHQPDWMTRIGSPFVTTFLFEALESAGHQDDIVGAIRTYYQPMVDSGATTVWESFPSGTTGSNGFPTRSHCHGWASSPVHFLNRVVLGILPDAPGGASYRISPHLSGLEWAHGASGSVHGPVEVSWRKEGATLRIETAVPEGSKVSFERNPSMDGLTVFLNGKQQ